MSNSKSPPFPSSLVHNLFTSHQPNATIEHLARLLSTPKGIDRTLMLVQYSSVFTAGQLSRLLNLYLDRLATRFGNNASSTLLPGEKVVATFPAPPAVERLTSTIAGCKALAGTFGDVRTALRLWGLLAMWAWARGTYLSPPKDGLVKLLTWGQIGVNTAYYALEFAVYFAGKGVIRNVAPEKVANWMKIALWCFGGHVGMEFLRLYRVRSLRIKDRAEKGQLKAGVQGEKEADIAAMEKEEDLSWRTALQVNAAYAPLTVHWIMPELGLVNDTMYGLLGSAVALLYLRPLWKEGA